MKIFADTWTYLTESSNWTGDGGMLALLTQQLLLTFTALLVAIALGPAAGAVAGTPRSWRPARDQHLQRRPRDPDLRAARAARHRGLARHRHARALWPSGPGHADRARPLRAAADHHERVRRDP
jgi:hypothetical protein